MAENDFWDDQRLKKEILKNIENETYVLTRHAAEEQKNDGIDLQDTLNALKNGVHEKEKTGFNNRLQVWRYAMNLSQYSLHLIFDAFFVRFRGCFAGHT